MEDFFPYLLYVAVKYVSYASWCLVGVLWFVPDRGYLRGALLFGLGRLLLGMCLGLVIFFLALHLNNSTRNSVLAYGLVYVPVRILEWAVWFRLLRTRPVGNLLALTWVGGGVVVSCIADVPLGILE